MPMLALSLGVTLEYSAQARIYQWFYRFCTDGRKAAGLVSQQLGWTQGASDRKRSTGG